MSKDAQDKLEIIVEKPSPAAAATQEETKKTSIFDRLELPPWVLANLKSRRSQKIWLRCWVASWVAFLIMLPHPSLNILGNAAFFGILASLMIPANLPVQLFIFALATMIVGMCLGWGLGAAAMRGALAARDQVVLQAELQREAQSAAGLANPEALFQSDIFAGHFLDTRSSVVFGVFLGFGAFIFALIRAYAPKLTLMSVFGTVALDIFCSYGPLFPFAQYTILNSLLTSVACYVAIGIVVITFIFPETANHAALVTASALTGKLKNLVDTQEKLIHAPPEELTPGNPIIESLVAELRGVLGQIQGFAAGTAFIGAEFSWGKWNAEDVTGLQKPLTMIVSRFAAMHGFAKLVSHQAHEGGASNAPSAAATEEEASTLNDPASGDTYLLRQFRERNIAAEAAHGVRIQDVVPALGEATIDLRKACSEGLATTQVLLDGINTRRYARHGAKESEQHLLDLDAAIDHLQVALADFKKDKRLMILRPFEGLVDSARLGTDLKGPLPLRALYTAYVFAANLIVLAEAIEHYMEYVQSIATKRVHNRLWAPGGLRAIVKALREKGDAGNVAAGEDDEPTVERRDPDSKPPTHLFQRIANTVHHLYKWTKTPEALFVARYVLVTILLWLPAVLKRSAHFIYAQKGLWALIMAQTTLNIYASDQIFNVVGRLLGSFVGGVAGLVTWYIGAGRGPGSPYGLAAIVGVMLVPIVFLRLFTPPKYLAGVLLSFATWVLVVGYSWLDTHIPTFGNPGKGWDVAWRRWVLVLIGSAASFILMMLPPKSGRKAVRLRNASILLSLASLYSDIISVWISAEGTTNIAKPKSQADWVAGVRAKIVSLAAKLQALKQQTALAKWEGSIRGAWPMEEYMKLIEEETKIMANLSLLGSALAQLDNETLSRFLRHTIVVNPNFIADVMATFSLVSQALKTGEPIPQAFHQNLLDRLHYHGRARYGSTRHDQPAREIMHKTHLESITQLEYVFYASAIAAVYQVLDGLNECRSIATRLCGEVPLQGWARWKNDYDRMYAEATG
ncbi:hypothetical protein BDY19DRAFT_986266 [Irpex rosettiformis]|uniref:Uncharacterized protein n=1 Tax=Irpex rosettiformis TaxID=378272 RepID=A0ACB8TZ05_9APHY|nr:hypothetical protein BDY19DRAFT_986266 [Irpex rosettiformis]